MNKPDQVALILAEISRRIAGLSDRTRPRLRFDKVALRVVSRLQAALNESVPDGMAVIITITAPIREPAKTVAVLEEKIRARLARAVATPVECEDTICGNQIRVRVVTSVSREAAKVIAFVHNPGPDAAILLDMTQSLLQQP